jgi:protocatechuate 4,5-dioxygenase alpha chain
MTNSIDLTLAPPGTYVYTAKRALEGHRLTRFGLSLRRPDNRAAFLRDETGYMRGMGLTETEIGWVIDRNWTALIRAGGHLQSMLKVAATVGQSLWHIGAHNAGMTPQELQALCPRRIDITPEVQ